MGSQNPLRPPSSATFETVMRTHLKENKCKCETHCMWFWDLQVPCLAENIIVCSCHCLTEKEAWAKFHRVYTNRDTRADPGCWSGGPQWSLDPTGVLTPELKICSNSIFVCLTLPENCMILKKISEKSRGQGRQGPWCQPWICQWDANGWRGLTWADAQSGATSVESP